MPTNLLGALINLFRSRGIVVEIYLGGSDANLKEALAKAGYPGAAACASLSYEWIANQLLKGHVAAEDNPMFSAEKFGAKDRERVANRQLLHQLGLTAMTQTAKQSKSLKNLDPGEVQVIKNYPYQALIDQDALATRLTSEKLFGPWEPNGASDKNIVAMFADLAELSKASFAAEAQLKQGMTAIPRRIDPSEGLTLEDYRAAAGHWNANFDRIANQSPDYFAILAVRSGAFGHAFGIRHQPAANLVHFFDPNIGHFKFQGWKDAVSNIQAYWRTVWQEDVYRDKDSKDTKQPAKTEVYPADRCFLSWSVYQFRRKPLDEDFIDFLW